MRGAGPAGRRSTSKYIRTWRRSSASAGELGGSLDAQRLRSSSAAAVPVVLNAWILRSLIGIFLPHVRICCWSDHFAKRVSCSGAIGKRGRIGWNPRRCWTGRSINESGDCHRQYLRRRSHLLPTIINLKLVEPCSGKAYAFPYIRKRFMSAGRVDRVRRLPNRWWIFTRAGHLAGRTASSLAGIVVAPNPN